MPSLLKNVSITFNTHEDDKNDSSVVHVFVKNRLNNSLSPEQSADFTSNWLAFQRYQAFGDISDGDRNPYLASKLFQALGDTYHEGSSQTIALDLVSPSIDVNDVVLPVVEIHMLANGNDRWIFDYTVTLTFDNGAFSFTSAVDGVPGIVLDQDNRNHSGFGVENPLRTLPIPALTTAATNAILKKVILEFSTHNDDKNDDTLLNVHIVNRLSATSAQDISTGLDLKHGQRFPDSGSPADLYQRCEWSSDAGADGVLASDAIRLADMILPVVNIVMVPSDDDQWIFDYRVTFEFEDPADFGRKRQFYSSQTNGVILDQTNNKHSGVYQGRPFPTVAPPTAPPLTLQPVNHTGDRQKKISIPLLRRKFDEFLNNRNGPDTGHNPPLQKINLGSSGRAGGMWPPVWPLPESYVDTQSITAAKIGDHLENRYVSNPRTIGQMKHYWGLADAFLGDIESEKIHVALDVRSAPPVTLRVDFKRGGWLWISSFGTITLDQFSIEIGLTLDKTVPGQHGEDYAVVDVMSWVSELQNMTTTTLSSSPSVYRYAGTFLGQPVDLVSPLSRNDLFVEQVIKVAVQTGSWSDPGDTLRTTIRDTIYSTLTTPDVITKAAPRDGLNSTVTSWLLGGVADDEFNADENNARVLDIGIENSNPELGIPEDTLVITYTGPRNVFVPELPPAWPAGHDFSPGTLANIDHIVVLMMENRSFDHMLGYLSLPASKHGMDRQDIDGLKGDEFNIYNGETFLSFELTDTIFSPDPAHGYEPVHHAIDGGQMSGFVKSYAEAHGNRLGRSIMGFHSGTNVPVFDRLARDFAIGHRWFASHPGPTFCNRFYELTGRLNLDPRGFWEFDNSSPQRPVYTPTIFDYLSNAVDPQTQQPAPVTWRYFEHGYCFLRFFEGHTFDDTNIVAADDPHVGFVASARAGTLPSVTFIDPHFIEYPPGGNCDGPPADVKDGQDFVQRVVEEVVAGPAWEKTLLLIVYDEHGGFFDHVPPPPAVPVSSDLSIRTHGVRVPAFVISPWIGAGTVFGHDATATPGSQGAHPSGGDTHASDAALHFDHTSILKTIARRFLSADPPYMGARFATAQDLSSVIGTQLQQPQFRPFIRYRLEYTESAMMLDVQFANRAAGTMLWQFPANGTVAQDFSFEDAGGGFVYIRSYVSNLYVTVRIPDPVVTLGDSPAAGAELGLIEDVKYAPSDVELPEKGPALQRWTLTPASISALDRDLYVISNEAHPGFVLQPADPTQAETPVVLGAPGTSTGLDHEQKAWKVTSPLLSDQIVSSP
jgi:phospholipase C